MTKQHFDWRDLLIGLATVVALAAGVVFGGGCETLPTPEQVSSYLDMALEAWDIIDVQLNPPEEERQPSEADRLWLEARQAVLEAIIERLQNPQPGAKSLTADRDIQQIAEIRAELGLR